MKLGLRVNAFDLGIWLDKNAMPPKDVWEPSVKRAADLGFDGVELCVWFPLSEWLNEEDTTKMIETAKKHNIEIATISADWCHSYSAYHTSLSDWLRCGNGIELFKGEIKLAAKLGAKSMLWHLGRAKGTMEELKKIFYDFAEEAEKQKVKIGIESSFWPIMGLGDQYILKELLDEINSEYFGVYIHGGRKVVEIMEKRSVGFHFYVMPGFPTSEEKFDYKALFDTFKKYYDYYIVFEPISHYTKPYSEYLSDKSLEKAKKDFDRIFTKYR